MKNLVLPSLILGLLTAASSVAAGTLYLPVVDLEHPAEGTYKTRVWITNFGDSPATVKILYLPGIGDNTRGRGAPGVHTVAPGRTMVLFEAADDGLLEIQAPDHVAVNAELRNTELPGPREVFGAVPVIGSDDAADAGGTIVLQGLRRSTRGIRTQVGLVNLGHEGTTCTVGVFHASGEQVSGTAILGMAPLSQLQFSDALAILGELQVGDVNARVSCDRPFYAYGAVYEATTGEIVFLRPSPTGASSLTAPAEPAPEPEPEPEPEPQPNPGSYVYSRSGTFHSPTKGNPSEIFNIPAPKNRRFRRIVLDMDFTHGGWNSSNPAGNHSLFWLHRGSCCTPWPAWKQNIVGFVNLYGPNKNSLQAVHNLDYTGETQYDNTVAFWRGLTAKAGQTYHLRYEYDAGGGKIRLSLSRGGSVVKEATVGATTSRIDSGPTGHFMAYFGHEPHPAGCNDCGPEVPSYGWKYSNLRVEFIE